MTASDPLAGVSPQTTQVGAPDKDRPDAQATGLFTALSSDTVRWLAEEVKPKRRPVSGGYWPSALFLSPQETAETVGALLEVYDAAVEVLNAVHYVYETEYERRVAEGATLRLLEQAIRGTGGAT